MCLAAIFSTLALLTAATGVDEETQSFDVGEAISTNFLVRMTDPRKFGYRIGVVNTRAATGMLIPSVGSRVEIEFFSGAENFLWVQAAKQLGTRHSDVPIRLTIARRRVPASACPEVAGAKQAFINVLESVLARRTSLFDSPPEAADNNEIVLDGTSFLIQLALSDGTLQITPGDTSESPLQRAAYQLHSVVSACSNDASSVIEEHDF